MLNFKEYFSKFVSDKSTEVTRENVACYFVLGVEKGPARDHIKRYKITEYGLMTNK